MSHVRPGGLRAHAARALLSSPSFLSFLLAASALASIARAGESWRVPLTVRERAGVARSGEGVLSGVPLPLEAQITSTKGLALMDADTKSVVEADFLPTSRWGGAPDDASRPIKWMLVAFRCTIPAGGEKRYLLVDHRPGPPTHAVRLTRGAEIWSVDTGAARFEIAPCSFDLFHRVEIGGREIVSPSPANGPYYSLDGTTYRASEAQGGSAIRVFRSGPRAQSLTLEIRGSHRTFAPGDPVLTDDEDLDFVTYLTFTAGSSAVRIHHGVQNNRNWVPLENNANFRNIGSPHSVYADEIGLRLRIDPGADPIWTIATGAPAGDGSGGGETYSGPLGSLPVSVYQDSSGDANWDQWRILHQTGSGEVPDPIFGPSSYVTFRGFEVREGEGGGGAVLASGEKMAGFLDLTGAGGGVTVAVRDLWQNFPKALAVEPDGTIRVGLFPREFRARHTLRVGEQKTDEILLQFHGPGAADPDGLGRGFRRPLFALAPPSWYAQITRSVATVSVDTPRRYRFPTIPGVPDLLIPDMTPEAWDAWMTSHLEGPGIPGYTFDGLDEAIPAAQMYGWMDFGDVPIDFEGQWEVFPTTLGCGGRSRSTSGQYGWKYEGDFGLLVNALRSGDPRFLDYGLAAVRHTADVDILHHGRRSGRGIHDFRDGGMFGHSEHNSAGDLNPPRNGTDPVYEQVLASCETGEVWKGTPTSDMIFGAGGFGLGYQLTGDPQLLEGLRDLADWTAFYVGRYGVDGERPTVNVLNTLGWGLEYTGDPAYREAGDAVVATSPYLLNPMPRDWLGGMLGLAVGRYVAVVRESGDRSLDSVLEAVDSTAPNHLEHYTYDLHRADAYGYAALLLPRSRGENLLLAYDCFASGCLWPGWEGGLYGHSRVWQIKEWVGSLRAGGAFQLAVYDYRGGPRFEPRGPGAGVRRGALRQNRPPVAMLAGEPRITVGTGEEVVFDASPSHDPDGAALRFFFDLGDGTRTPAGPRLAHTFLEPGIRTARVWASDGEGVDVARKIVEVLFVNHPPVAEAGPDRRAPVGVAVPFDASGSTDPDRQDLTYHWDFGDGAEADGMEVSHPFDAPATYSVVLTVSDGELTGVDTARVTVAPVAGEPVTVSFRDGENGYAGATDTRIWSKYPDYNYGSWDELFAGRQNYPELHSLLRFELEGIPEGARVEQATLTLTSSRYDSGETFFVHRITTEWVEGTGGWYPADGATWNTSDGVHAWSAGGGGDWTGEGIPFHAAPAGESVDIDVTPLVQGWLLAIPNDGFLIRLTEAASYQYAYFHAREALPLSVRPKLTVTFTPVE